MKNFICMVAFVVVSMGSFLNAKKQNVAVGFTNIESVEVMAKGEMDNGHWLEPQTVRCKYDYPDGSFTSSVERICVFADYMSNCIGVPCGVPF